MGDYHVVRSTGTYRSSYLNGITMFCKSNLTRTSCLNSRGQCSRTSRYGCPTPAHRRRSFIFKFPSIPSSSPKSNVPLAYESQIPALKWNTMLNLVAASPMLPVISIKFWQLNNKLGKSIRCHKLAPINPNCG